MTKSKVSPPPAMLLPMVLVLETFEWKSRMCDSRTERQVLDCTSWESRKC